MIPQFPITQEQAQSLEQFVSHHMERCWEVAYFDGEELPPELDDVAMFCGCETCTTREYLVSTFTWLRENGILDLYVE
jgi:hypothetical protein